MAGVEAMERAAGWVPWVDGHTLVFGAIGRRNLREGRTPPIGRADVLEVLLRLAPSSEARGAFRVLVERAPERAAARLADGLLATAAGGGAARDLTGLLAPEDVTPLLTHEDAAVRERAISGLGHYGGASGGRGR